MPGIPVDSLLKRDALPVGDGLQIIQFRVTWRVLDSWWGRLGQGWDRLRCFVPEEADAPEHGKGGLPLPGRQVFTHKVKTGTTQVGKVDAGVSFAGYHRSD